MKARNKTLFQEFPYLPKIKYRIKGKILLT